MSIWMIALLVVGLFAVSKCSDYPASVTGTVVARTSTAPYRLRIAEPGKTVWQPVRRSAWAHCPPGAAYPSCGN